MGKKRNKRKRKSGTAPKKKEIHYDRNGSPFVYETVFIRGKQKRVRRPVWVVDGEVIDDPDKWLLENACDITLHQMERWDLLEERRQAEDEREKRLMAESGLPDLFSPREQADAPGRSRVDRSSDLSDDELPF